MNVVNLFGDFLHACLHSWQNLKATNIISWTPEETLVLLANNVP